MVVIRNLHPKITAEMIGQILHPFGALRNVEVATKDGESRGYAHAEVLYYHGI